MLTVINALLHLAVREKLYRQGRKYMTIKPTGKRRAMYKKSDSDNAEAITFATINMPAELPDACPSAPCGQKL